MAGKETQGAVKQAAWLEKALVIPGLLLPEEL